MEKATEVNKELKDLKCIVSKVESSTKEQLLELGSFGSDFPIESKLPITLVPLDAGSSNVNPRDKKNVTLEYKKNAEGTKFYYCHVRGYLPFGSKEDAEDGCLVVEDFKKSAKSAYNLTVKGSHYGIELKESGQIIENKKHGNWVREEVLDNSYELKKELEFEHGIPHGKFLATYEKFNGNGRCKITIEGRYMEGQKQGKWKVVENGIAAEEHYVPKFTFITEEPKANSIARQSFSRQKLQPFMKIRGEKDR